MNPIQKAISLAIEATPPFTAKRNKALASVKWILCGAGVYVAPLNPDGSISLTASRSAAQVFDGRDNEALKSAFHSALLGRPFEAVLI